jgi:hypothetical protein
VSESSDSGRPSETRGEVLDVLRELLTGRRDDDVVALVTQLVANNAELALRAAKVSQLEKRNTELEKQLERVLARYKQSEAVSKAQLVLFIDALSRGEVADETTHDDDPRPDANGRLRDASGIDEPGDDEPKTKPPRNQPGRPKPAPPSCRACPTPSRCQRRNVPVPVAARSAAAWVTTSPRSSS